VLIVGCGYVGRRVAALHLARGEARRRAGRSAARAQTLERDGIAAIGTDLDGSPPISDPRRARLLLRTATERGTTDPRLAAFLAGLARSGQPRRIVYIGTTASTATVTASGSTSRVPPTFGRPRPPALGRECRLRDWSATTGGELVVLRVRASTAPAGCRSTGCAAGCRWFRRTRRPGPTASTPRSGGRLRRRDGPGAERRGLQRLGRPSRQHGDYFNRVADLAGLPRPPVVRLADADGRLSEGLLSYLRESRRPRQPAHAARAGVTLRYRRSTPACRPASPATIGAQNPHDRASRRRSDGMRGQVPSDFAARVTALRSAVDGTDPADVLLRLLVRRIPAVLLHAFSPAL